MSIDIRELERLHSIVLESPSVRGTLRSILGGASPWDQFCAYALDNFPDILSALRDKDALEQRAKRAETAMAVFWNRTGPHQGSTWMPTPLLQTWLDEADALLRDKERLDWCDKQGKEYSDWEFTRSEIDELMGGEK